ncbi:hypothetical protein CMI37_07005 [Candidatus Pacearchaeota archaeon]|nr:hypothetical protein [Candidatus Pacearchaeota archaeon]
MLSIKVKASPGLKLFLQKYPSLYEEARERATNKSLDLLQKESFDLAPYDTGTLRREIKQDYRNRRLVAGTYFSRPYAYVQEFGNKAGTLKPRRYFFGALKDNTQKVLDIFKKEFRRVLSGK